MRVLLFIVLLFVQQGWATDVKPLTDWQVHELKGQVKKMTVVKKSDNRMIIKMETEFDRQGYKTIKRFFNNNVGIDSVGTKMKLERKEKYLPYIDNKRLIMVNVGEEEKEEFVDEPLSKDTEYWFSDGQHVIINRGYMYEEYIKEMYNSEKKLLSREMDLLIIGNDFEYSSINKYFYTYDKEGELVRADIEITESKFDKEGYQIFEVQKRDKYGNIVQRTVKGDTGETIYVENFTYEYYN